MPPPSNPSSPPQGKKHTPQQSILAAPDPPSQDELLLPVHELLAETMTTTLEVSGNVGTLNGRGDNNTGQMLMPVPECCLCCCSWCNWIHLSGGLVGRAAGALPVRGVKARPVHVRMSHLMNTKRQRYSFQSELFTSVNLPLWISESHLGFVQHLLKSLQ